MKSLKILIICKHCPADHFKAERKGLKGQFPRYLQFRVLYLYHKSGLLNFFHEQALGGAKICLTVQQILGNSTKGNATNLARKIRIFFAAKQYVME